MSTWFYQPLEEEECKSVAESSITQLTISCGLICWILLCYIPQWARLISRKSAEGISTFYILLGSLSGACAVGNILTLPSSSTKIGCCYTTSRLTCISNLLGIFQVVFGIGCFWVVLFMFFHYSESLPHIATSRTTFIAIFVRKLRRTPQGERVLLVSNGFAFLIFLISAVILHSFPNTSQTWADILGVSLAVGACLQWLPQIMTTWQLGHLGSLSPVALCFTTPYTWVFGVSMISRVGLAGWSAWIVYVLVGSMQLVLLGLAMVFTRCGPDRAAQLDDDKRPLLLDDHLTMSQFTLSRVDERSPLLIVKEAPAS